jgi:alkylation response protein AidB-like acyl-CoA dehydrogenase
MNFDFSDDQKQMRDAARKFLTEKCPPKAVREVLDGKVPYDKALWQGLAEMGFLGVAIPEEFGGAGAGHLELCVIAEEMGRANAPVPFSSTVYLAAEALLIAGSDAQKQKWLPKVASGEAIGTLALFEGKGNPSPKAIKLQASGGTLNGVKKPVPDGAIADFAVGGSDRALEMGRDYALDRIAFGRPIGSFQAVKHILADMYVSATLARSNCYYGAWALSTNASELPEAAAAARISATQAFQHCSKNNIQVHGGMGFTWEFDCHMYYRRANTTALTLGSLSYWEDQLIDRMRKKNAA